MSTIQTINLGGIIPPQGPISPPQMIDIPQPKATLLSDDDIDKLIESQKINTSPEPIQMANAYQPPIEQPKPNHEENNPKDDVEVTIDFDMVSMNTNLNEIIVSTKSRITELCKMQQRIKDRIILLEKFIKLDEKELAIEISKTQQNDSRIRGIRNSIVNQTELFGNTMDILLKFESSIQTWTKTLMDVEKDKVSAYQKIKSVNKDQTTTESDINEVLNSLNFAIKNSPEKIAQIADNQLTIGGYSGKKFTQS